jgi:DNA-binding NarL/FixJ family response regulator
MEVRILIVDDHEIVRKGIREIIRLARPEWNICGEASTGAEAVEKGRALKPDVAILDIAMPGMNGIEAASRIAGFHAGCRLLLFTMYESKELVAVARRAKAHGYVLKSQAANHLILAIDRILAGQTFFGGPEDEGAPGKKSPGGGLILCRDMGLCGI